MHSIAGVLDASRDTIDIACVAEWAENLNVSEKRKLSLNSPGDTPH